MERAVVSIGVKKTGGLPELQAAVESAQAVADWAKTHQGIPASRAEEMVPKFHEDGLMVVRASMIC